MSEIRELRELHLDSIRIDPALQPRESLDQAVVVEYAEAMGAGDAFPPVMVFYDGAVFWLADGWHRVSAARSVRGKTTIAAEIREGTRQDALLYSVGANAAHGLRRSNADKRKAVERVLADPEWAKWSDREIGRVCRVGHPLVARIRGEVKPSGIDSRRTFERGGTVATMDTAPIAAANEARASVNLDRDLPAKSVRTETLVVPFGKDAELIGKVSRTQAPIAATPPREPSAWAPELKPKQDQEQTPDSPKLPENETIVEVATRVAVLSDEVIKRGMWPATYKPAMDLAEASRVLATMVLELADDRLMPDPPAQVVEAMAAAETTRNPFPVGSAVRWGDKTGTVLAWKAQGRTVEVQDESGRRFDMPAWIVTETDPA